MFRSRTATRSVRVLLAAVVLFQAACGGSDGESAVGRLGLAGVELAVPTERPDFVLHDTSGERFDFRDRTDGRLTLVYFGYTSCPDACPVHLAQLSEVLSRPGMPDADVLFITVDPARDSPEIIEEYLGRFDDDFVGLTGSIDELIDAQNAAGVVPADPEDLPEGQDYIVGHAGQLLVYAPDDKGYVIYPFGTRQSELVADLPRLAEFTGIGTLTSDADRSGENPSAA